MTIFNLGSINADFFYDVPHIPKPGETLAATAVSQGLGGKGANQSVAMAMAGCKVQHIGAIGVGGTWLVERLADWGVDVSAVYHVDGPTGHAVICVSQDGENAITLLPGSNQEIPLDHIQRCLEPIKQGDWLVLQNETNGVKFAAERAKAAGAKVAYSAAPFSIDAISDILPFVDLLAVNEGEAAAMQKSFSQSQIHHLKEIAVLKTMGPKGAELRQKGDVFRVPGLTVDVVDTTAAGDTFLGFFLSCYSANKPILDCLNLANGAAALKVTRKGTANAIPTLAQVQAFIS